MRITDEQHFAYFYMPFKYVGDDFDTFEFRINSEIWKKQPYIINDDRNYAALTEDDRKFSGWGRNFISTVNNRIAGNCDYYTIQPGQMGIFGNPLLTAEDDNFKMTDYKVTDISMFAFSSCVGMLVYKVADTSDNADEYSVAEMCFNVKRPGRVRIGTENDSRPLMLALNQLFSRDMLARMKFFFNNADPSDGQAYFMSFNYNPEKPGRFTTDNEQLNKLYAARYGYNRDYVRPAGFEYDDYKEILALVENINFGITSDGMACLTYGCGSGKMEKYLKGKFNNDFCSSYLLMYALLLHQRYFLCSSPDKDGMKKYRSVYRIAEISDKLKVQRLYERTYKQFDIEQLKEEAENHIPAEDTNVIRAMERESTRIGAMLTVLAIFGVFSAGAGMMSVACYMNGTSRKYLWLIIVLSMIIFGIGAGTVTYMRDNIVKMFISIKEDQKSHKFIYILLALFLILLIFVIKWRSFV